MPSDIAIGTTTFPVGAPTLKKPPYLVTLEENTGKTRATKRFISLDKPESINGFIQVKGIFSDKSEDEIVKTYSEILTSCPKEDVLEMMFPLHKIHSIRSLVFNAVKSQTAVAK